jgi:OmpA-OmpF porin, OOP family
MIRASTISGGNMTIRRHAVLMALAGLGFIVGGMAPVMAEEGLYAGGGIARAEASDFCDGVIGTCDDNDLGWQVFVGYDLTRNFSIEGGYVDFGTVSLTGIVPGLEDFGSITASVDSDGWFAHVLGRYPVTPEFSLHGKLGLANTRAQFSLDEFDGFNERGTDWVAGLGAGYRFTPNVSLRVEWERYNNVGDTDENYSVISGSLIYHFR